MEVWLALDDVDENNGALIAVKGSHKLADPDLAELKERFHPNEDVPSSSTPLFNAFNQKLINAAEQQRLVKEVCTVKKGDKIIWNHSTLHGGLSHINKARTRGPFVMHITPKNMPINIWIIFFTGINLLRVKIKCTKS
jgi:phytanoyl-CoA hydroxylase